jgi:hypothetical protein
MQCEGGRCSCQQGMRSVVGGSYRISMYLRAAPVCGFGELCVPAGPSLVSAAQRGCTAGSLPWKGGAACQGVL